MRPPLLPLLAATSLALAAPRDTSATTTAAGSPTIPSTFPLQTAGAHADAALPATGPVPDGTVTSFAPGPTAGLAARWYITTYWSCVTWREDYTHCGWHEPVRPGVGPDGDSFGAAGRKRAAMGDVAVGVGVALAGAAML